MDTPCPSLRPVPAIPSFPSVYRQRQDDFSADDDWWCGEVNTRKRKFDGPDPSGYDGCFGRVEEPSVVQKSSRLDPELNTTLHRAISEFNVIVMEPVFKVMPSHELRRIAAVNSEWCYHAYKELRRRFGNAPFPMLLLLEGGDYVCLRSHFHPALIRPKEDQNRAELISNDSTSSNQVYCIAVEKGLSKKKKSLEDVELILTFGSDEQMCRELVDSGCDIPAVPVFLMVAGPLSVSYYTTPDGKNVGDSRNGVYMKKGAEGSFRGNSFGSICVPRSPHLEIQGTILAASKKRTFGRIPSYSNACLRLNELLTRPVKTKIVIVLKYFEDCEGISRFRGEEIMRAFLHDGVDNLTVISIECSLSALGGSKVCPVGSHTPSLGSALTFKGDEHFTYKVIELWEAKGRVKKLSFQNCFDQLLEFILPSNRLFCPNLQTSYCQFAILLSYNEHLNDGNVDTSSARRVLDKFHQTFPHVPITGVGTDRPLSHELITCMNRNPLCHSSTSDNPKPLSDAESNLSMILLVFKYPSKSETPPTGSYPESLVEKVEEMDLV